MVLISEPVEIKLQLAGVLHDQADCFQRLVKSVSVEISKGCMTASFP